MSTPQQERVQFKGASQHAGATGSFSAKNFRSDTVRATAARIDTVKDSTGDEVFSRSGRRINETASQTASGLGVDGVVWVRSADSKLIYTDDTDTDYDLTDVGLSATLTRGNDANDQTLQNLGSLNFASGIQLGNVTTSAGAQTAVAVGKSAVTAGNANEIAIGASAETAEVNSIAIGESAIEVSSAYTETGLIVGSGSTAKNFRTVIGRNTSSATGSGGAYGNYGYLSVLICSNVTKSSSDFRNVAIGSQSRSIPVLSQRYTTFIGSEHYGNSQGEHFGSVQIGRDSGSRDTSAVLNDLAIGAYSRATTRGISIGSNSGGGAAVATTIRACCIGAYAQAANASGFLCSVGSHMANTGQYSILIGANTSATDNLSCSGTGDVLIGQELESALDNTVMLGTGGLRSTVDDEFIVAGMRMIRGTLSSAVHGNVLLASFPLATAGSVVKIDATATAITGANETAVLVFRDYHFRNISGTVSLLSNIETSDVHDPDAVTGFAGSLGVSGTTIEFRVTCTTAAAFTGLMQVWCAPA